ncbi:MAG: c-type cytochrome [Candidatus Azosocius agrarius]|nr:MAG: c-type cytochrome [Gammaproteobacteria bacterium]
MLSKSLAIKFFLIGTSLAALCFFLLSYDTLKQIPAQTNEQNLNSSAIRGKHIWENNNCMGCHTIFGEGAYYAPELTKVYERRSESFLKIFLKDPQKMYPGKRKMVNYNFSDSEIEDVISFFKWINDVDLNGFPLKPSIEISKSNVNSLPSNKNLSINKPKIFEQLCMTCHMLNGQGGTIGPSLDNIGNIRDKNYLKQWLNDPYSLKKDSLMPKLPLTNENINELVDFLLQVTSGDK